MGIYDDQITQLIFDDIYKHHNQIEPNSTQPDESASSKVNKGLRIPMSVETDDLKRYMHMTAVFEAVARRCDLKAESGGGYKNTDSGHVLIVNLSSPKHPDMSEEEMIDRFKVALHDVQALSPAERAVFYKEVENIYQKALRSNAEDYQEAQQKRLEQMAGPLKKIGVQIEAIKTSTTPAETKGKIDEMQKLLKALQEINDPKGLLAGSPAAKPPAAPNQ